MRPRFEVKDEITWGKLIKSLATGKNYVVPGGPPIAVPRTLQELKDTCVALGLEVTIPDFHTGLVIIQLSEEVFSIRLPPKTMVEEAEAFLMAGGAYSVPKFYDDFYDATLNITDPDQKLDFQAARIGDYSVRMCQ